MRRFIQVAAVTSFLLPGVAWGHAGEEPTTGGDQQSGTQAGTTTTTTTAAPAATDDGSPTSGGSTTSGGAPADTIAPAAPTAPTATPALLPFRNSTLLLDQSTTPETLWRNVQQSAIPSYQWWISFRPRWYFTPSLSLRARVDLTTEWADGGDTTRAREPVWGDIWTDLVYSGIPELAGIKFSVGLRALWPTSLASRMRSVYVALGATAGASRTFDMPNHGGDINVGLSFAGSHAFTGYNNGGVNSTYGCSSFDMNTPQTCDSRGGPMNAAFNLTSIFLLGYNTPLHGLGFNFMYLLANSWAYGAGPQTITDPTGGTSVVNPDPNATFMRQNSWFLASADYEVTREVSLSLGYYVYRPVLDPNSTYGNPFWSPGGNSRIFFTITASLDGIYQTIRGVPRQTSSAHAANTAHPSMNQIARDLRAQQVSNGTF